MVNQSSLHSLVNANLRKISSSNTARINGRTAASKLLFHICYCSFQQGRPFWNKIKERDKTLLEILAEVDIPCNIRDFYGSDENEIARLQCGDLEIAAELRESIISSPTTVAEIIIAGIKNRNEWVESHYMREELADICAWILESNGCKHVYNPYAGLGDLECALASSNITLHSLCTDILSEAITHMRAEMCGAININTEVRQPNYLPSAPLDCDTIFMFLPIGLNISLSDVTGLDRPSVTDFLLTSCPNKCFVILPADFGFGRNYKELRRDLLLNGLTHVIALPTGIIPGTSITHNLLIIDRSKHNGVINFVSLRHCYKTKGRSKSFDLDEAMATLRGNNAFYKTISATGLLKSEDAVLSPGKHLLDAVIPRREGYQRYRLNELITRIPTTRCTKYVPSRYKVVGAKDLSYVYDYAIKSVSPTVEARGVTQRLETDGVLLMQTPSGFKMGLSKGASSSSPLYLSPLISPVTVLAEVVDTEYLLAELSAEYIKQQIELLTETITPKDVSDEIWVLLPSLEKQREHTAIARLQRIADLGGEVETATQDFRRDVHMKRHAMGQTIGAVNNWWSLLEDIRDANANIIDGNATVGGLDLTLDEVLRNLRQNIKRLSTQIDKLDRGYKYTAKRLAIFPAIQEYLSTHTTPVFRYEVGYDKVHVEHPVHVVTENKFYFYFGSDDKISTAEILFPKEVLYMIFNNIMSNASTHGFKNTAKSGNVVRVQIWAELDTITISISNNGEPCAADMTPEKIMCYGESSNIEKHCGIGGYEINFLMREFNQKLELHLNEDDEFPVEYRLIFKLLEKE